MGELLELKEERPVKYLDEYRDARQAHEYARQIARVTTRPWAHHGGLRRPDPCHRQVRD